jgi:hypothetical protein
MTAIVVHLPVHRATPPAAQLLGRIRVMARQGRMRFDHPHVQQRLQERTLNMRMVLETIKKGTVVGAPRLDQWGDWRLKLRRKVAGRRVQIVVAVKTDHFVVVTVI